MATNRLYLGDGVYAGIERGMVKLTTEDGIRETNTIYLEPGVCASLLEYIDHFANAIVGESTDSTEE